MKNIEKYIIVILSFIAVGAIGTAIYFGVNSKQLKEQDKVGETDKQENNDKNDECIDNIADENEIVEIYPNQSNDHFDKTKPLFENLSLDFHNNYYYKKDKVLIYSLSDEAKIQLIVNQFDIKDECLEDKGCYISKSIYDEVYIELFGEKPKVINKENDKGLFSIKYDKELNKFHLYVITGGDEDCFGKSEYILSQNTYDDRIEYITVVSSYDGCEENMTLCGKECVTLNVPNEYNYDYIEKETIKNQDKFDKYKYTFKYSDEYNTYYFYSVERIK